MSYLQIINNLTREQATEILKKVSEGINLGYPPYKEGQQAFHEYINAISNNSEAESLLAAKKLRILMDVFNCEK